MTASFSGAITDQSQKCRVGFIATAETRRADFGLVWELRKELGLIAAGGDVTIEVEAEATMRTAP